MNPDKKASPNAAFDLPSKAVSFLPHLGNPPLSFIMPCRYMGWTTTATGPMHKYLLACGHTYTSTRKRSQGSACFCPDCAEAWAESATEPETLADRLELTDTGFTAIELFDASLTQYGQMPLPIAVNKSATKFTTPVTEDTCQNPLRGFPTNP